MRYVELTVSKEKIKEIKNVVETNPSWDFARGMNWVMEEFFGRDWKDIPDAVEFPMECDTEDCGCPCFDYCKEKMIGVDHFCCEDVYTDYLNFSFRTNCAKVNT